MITETETLTTRFSQKWVILGILFGIGINSLIYQLALTTALVFLLGEGILVFSICTGLFLFAMGVGVYRANKKEVNHRFFFNLQTGLGCFGLLALPTLFAVFALLTQIQASSFTHITSDLNSNLHLPFWSKFILWSLGLVFTFNFGSLTGMNLPVLQAIYSTAESTASQVARLLSYDYLGSFLGSVAFPLFLFPHFGLFRSSLLASFLNSILAATALSKIPQSSFKYRMILFLLICLQISFFLFIPQFENWITTMIYQ